MEQMQPPAAPVASSALSPAAAAAQVPLPMSPAFAPAPPPFPSSDREAALDAELASLRAQLAARTQELDDFKLATATRAAAQLEDRLLKVVSLLTRFASNPAEPVPPKTPDFLRVAIDTLRGVVDRAASPARLEADRLRLENATLVERLQSAAPALDELAGLRDAHAAALADAESLRGQLDELDAALHEAEERADRAAADAAQADAEREAAGDEMAHWQREAQRMADEAANLQAALDAVQATARADAEYRQAQHARKVEAVQAALEAAEAREKEGRERVAELEADLDGKNAAIRELQAEVHSLTHHIQHKLADLASHNEVDRALVANLVIQFVTQPPVRRWEILTPLAAMLCFTPEQRVAVGLDKPPTAGSTPAGTAPASAAGSRRVSSANVVEDGTADPIKSPTSATAARFEQSLSEKFISFLLREVSTSADEPPANV
ncbi:hypothetical protein H9P43_007254 [Blastocladiella emersonii ATCC 22665]|nr:hypothetical protein H9P43_007254 [Blastocladiella emersonii ATCC 22665]